MRETNFHCHVVHYANDKIRQNVLRFYFKKELLFFFFLCIFCTNSILYVNVRRVHYFFVYDHGPSTEQINIVRSDSSDAISDLRWTRRERFDV